MCGVISCVCEVQELFMFCFSHQNMKTSWCVQSSGLLHARNTHRNGKTVDTVRFICCYIILYSSLCNSIKNKHISKLLHYVVLQFDLQPEAIFAIF